jgi:hypothetical protein
MNKQKIQKTIQKTITFGIMLFLVFSSLYLPQSPISSVKTAQAADAWYNGSWGYRVKITVNSAQVPSTQTDFPVYVKLSDLPAGFFTHVRSDGGDIRVTKSDGTTELPREVVTITTGSSTGELWFKADSIANATYFYIYYGNASATEPAANATYGSQNVWTNSFKAVYHLQQDPSGNGANSILDSTSNAYHLTPSGTPANGTGKLSGNAITFGGVDEQLKDTDQVWANADNEITYSAWVNEASADGAQNSTIFRYVSSGNERASAHIPWGNITYWDFGTCCTDGRVNGDYTPYDDKYSLVHLVSNGSTNKIIYIDGASRYSNMSLADNPSVDLTGFVIGSGVDAEWYKGTVDEVRVATTTRTADWVTTEYNNQNSTTGFYTASTEEAGAPTVIYRSVGPSDTSNLNTNNRTVTISGTTATFSDVMPDNIGVGDVLEYPAGAPTYVAFITGRTSSTVYTVASTTGGTPTATGAGTAVHVHRAYTSLANAESGTKNTSITPTFTGGNRDLVANNEQWNIALYANGTTADTAAVSIDGWTTGANNYLNIYTPTLSTEVGTTQRHNGKWDTGKYRLSISTSWVPSLMISESYVRIIGLQVEQLAVSDGSYSIITHLVTDPSDILIDNSVVNKTTNSVADGIYVGSGSVKVRNSVITNSGRNGIYSVWSTSNPTLVVENCTISKSGAYGISRLNGTVTVKNTYSGGNILDDYNGTMTFTTSASSDSTVRTGVTSSVANSIANFANVTLGSEDYHLTSTSALKNIGTDLSTTFTTDIDGAGRPTGANTWDIGADESPTQIYRSVAAGAINNLNTSDNRSVEISGNTATFSNYVQNDIGVGDVLQYNPGTGYRLAFISGRTSDSVFTVQSADGGTASSTSAGTSVSVFRAYTSLANAESGIENTSIDTSVRNFDDWTSGGTAATDDVGKNLITPNQQWNIALYANGITADTSAVTVDGWTAGINNYIKIYTPTALSEVKTSQRHQGKWDNTRYHLALSTNNAYNLYLLVPYTQVDGLQIVTTTFSRSYNYGISIAGPSTQVKISNNIVKEGNSANQFDSGIAMNSSTIAPVYIWNNIVYGFNGPNASAAISLYSDYGVSPSYAYNNTVFNSTTGIGTQYGDGKAVNNLVVNCTNAFNGTFVSGSDYNVTDINDSTQGELNTNPTHDKANQAITFVDATNNDFHLAWSDTGAKGAGTDLSADANISFNTDIDGQTRTGTWDAGVDRPSIPIFRSVGAGATTALTTGTSNSMSISNSIATFSSALPDNIGVGDAIQYDSDVNSTIDSIAFINSRIDSTHYGVQKADGTTATSTSASDNDWSIFRAYTSLANAVDYSLGGTENTGINNSVRNFDNWTGGKDLVSANQQWNVALYANGGAGDTAGFDVQQNGWVTSNINFINIFTPTDLSQVGVSQRHSGKWDASKYWLENTANRLAAVISWIPNVRFDGLQIREAPTEGYNASGVGLYGSDTSLSNSIIKYEGSGNTGYVGMQGGGGAAAVTYSYQKIWNNIFYGFRAGIQVGGMTNLVLNNTIAYCDTTDADRVGIQSYWGRGPIAINNIVQGCGDGYNGGSFLSISDYNISDLSADTTGGAHDKQATVSFVDAAGKDFRLLNSDTSAVNAGYNIANDSNTPLYFTTDIAGQTRSGLWDIGASESVSSTIYRSVAPGMTSNLNTSNYTVTISGTTATFSGAMPDNVGVGDVLQYDPGSGLTLAFISGRTSSTQYTVQSVSGGVPTSASGKSVSVFRAYTSLANAEAGIENTGIDNTLRNFDDWTAGGDATTDDVGKNLVTANQQWNIVAYANGSTADTSLTTISGWTSNSTNFIKIFTPTLSSEVGISQRHLGKPGTSNYRIDPSVGGTPISIAVNYTQVIGLEILSFGQSGFTSSAIYSTVAYNTISHNLIHDEISGNNAGGILMGGGASGGHRIYNNIIENNYRGIGINNWLGVNSYVYNNTVIDCPDTGIRSENNDVIAINNLVKGSGDTNAYIGGFFAGTDYNATNGTDSIGQGTHNRISQAFNFVDAPNGDFHLDTSDTGAKDVGVNLSADSYLAFTTDIDGQVRTLPWDIGADESLTATTPGIPTNVYATAGNAYANIYFTAPASNGGSAITSYTVTSTPGGLTSVGSISPITITGLTNNTSYTFTVHATNAIGNSGESVASNSVTPTGATVVVIVASYSGGSVSVEMTSGGGTASVGAVAPSGGLNIPLGQVAVGPNGPTTAVSDGSIGAFSWGGIVQNFFNSEDGNFVNATVNAHVFTQYLKVTNFGFNIPTNSTINGIKVEVKKAYLASPAIDNAVRIVKQGVIGATDKKDVSQWLNSFTYTTYGSISDLWGETWTPNDINSSNFGFAISADNVSSPGSALIDYIRITVYYTPSGDSGGGEQTGGGETVGGGMQASP